MKNRTRPMLLVGGILWLTLTVGAVGCGSTSELPLFGRPVAAVTVVDANICSTPEDEEALVAEIVARVNEERAQNGLNAVTIDPELTAAAQSYACTMITDDYFGHYHPVTGQGPGERATQAGYLYRAVGENLAAGQRTSLQAMTDWMNSTAGHRENILNPMWVHIGVSIRKGGKYGTYWVQEFGAPWPGMNP